MPQSQLNHSQQLHAHPPLPSSVKEIASTAPSINGTIYKPVVATNLYYPQMWHNC